MSNLDKLVNQQESTLSDSVEKLHLDPVTKEMISKSELKRRMKKREKETAKKPISSSKKDDSSSSEDEDLDPRQYYEKQCRSIQKQLADGENPYPNKFQVTLSVPEFLKKFESLKAGEHLENESVSLAGRINTKRSSGTKLVFYDLKADGEMIVIEENISYYF